MAVDLPSPTILDYVLILFVFVCVSLPYLNSLEGNMCYDDKVAVGGNPDVVMPNVTLWDIATHDFWGNDILRRRLVLGIPRFLFFPCFILHQCGCGSPLKE